MRHRKLHPVTNDMRRIVDIRVLTKAGAFKRPMRFPFQHLEVTAPDHVRVFRVGDKSRQSPQIVAVTWRKMTFGMKPFFICPRCNARRVFLYFDTLQAYCRCCADLWFRSQQVRRRTRLLLRAHRIRASLGGDQLKPGSPFPARPHLQRKTTYRRIISTLRHIEQQYLHIIATDRRCLDRERDEVGRLLPREQIASADNSADDLGR
jgi:hypothetical protein